MILYVNDCRSFTDFVNVILEKLRKPDHGCGKANIIIADLKLYKNHYLDGSELKTTVNYINGIGNISVTLVESLSELITILGEHFLAKEKPKHLDLPPIDTDTKIIGLYGIFNHFVIKGNHLMAQNLQANLDNNEGTDGLSDIFMDVKDYSAKTVNFICYLMYNLKFYKKYEIYMNDPYEEIEGDNTKMSYLPIIWNLQVPNLQPEDKACCVAQAESNIEQEVDNREENLVVETLNDKSSALDNSELDTSVSYSHKGNDSNEFINTSLKQMDLVPLGLILSKWVKTI